MNNSSSMKLLGRRHACGTNGVALVLVLGALSLMLMLAVSFAISMRTERLAAGNYLDSVRARQMAQVGLARAMNDICAIMGTNLGKPNSKPYPTWTVTNSYVNSANTYATNILRGSASNFVPRALLAYAPGPSTNQWVEIWANDAGALKLAGRVGYLIFNCSGLLDANFAGAGGAGVPRQYGTNPAEIAVAKLDEIGSGANNLPNNRVADIRYESAAELHEYSDDSTPSNFSVYSYFPGGYWTGITTNDPVNLAGDAAALRDRSGAIKAGFINAGFSAAEADILTNNLIDYVDTGYVPGNMTTGVKPVPMINEVAVSNRIEQVAVGPPPTYRSVAEVAVEWWYPFVRPGDAYEVRSSAAFTWLSGNIELLPTPFVNNPALISPSGPAMDVIRVPVVSSEAAGAASVRFRSTISLQVLKGGSMVDNVTVILTNDSSLTADRSAVEFIDPRFNGNMVYANYTSTPSLGLTNAGTLNYWSVNPGCDPDLTTRDTAMYVANAQLHSVGELGYLAYAPWKTVKLYGPNLHRVLDVFAIGTNATDPYVTGARRGLVNPNSLQDDALAAVFADMPVDRYPLDPGAIDLDIVQARDLADRVYNEYLLSANFTNLSDFGRGMTNFDSLGAIVFDNELKKESVFRNACGLLSVRQNLFTIVIEAQAASSGVLPRNAARQRAVALVWRDPYTGEFFVRSFQWLED